MKATATRVLASVNRTEERTTFLFKPLAGSYTSEQITMDGGFNAQPGQTVMVTITNVETE